MIYICGNRNHVIHLHHVSNKYFEHHPEFLNKRQQFLSSVNLTLMYMYLYDVLHSVLLLS